LENEIYRQIVESAYAGIWLIDTKGKTLYVNRRFSEMLGYAVDEILGKSFYDFMTEEDKKIAEKNMDRRRHGIPENHDFKFLKKDGSPLWTLISTNPLFTDDGQVKGALAIVLDITERKQDEKTRTDLLSQSRSFLDSLIENIPLMVFVKDAKNLRFVRLNRAGEDLIGHPRSELMGKNDRDFFPDEQANAFIEKDREVLKGRSIIDIPEEQLQSRNQGVRILHTKKIPLVDAKGNPEYLLGISEDITEKKKIEDDRMRLLREKAIHEEREKQSQRYAFFSEASAILGSSFDYHTSLKNLAEFMVPRLCDWCHFTIIKDENTAERTVAFHRDVEKNNLLQETLKNSPIGPYTAGSAHMIATGESHLYSPVNDAQLRHETSDENMFHFYQQMGCAHFLRVPMVARRGVLGMIGLFTIHPDRPFDEDLKFQAEELGRRAGTAIENALLYEEARRAIEIRDEFLSIASHELKTPITSLRLQLQMSQRQVNPELNQQPPPEKILKVLSNAITQVDRLTHLIEDLLDVSRIQAGKVSFNFAPTDLSALVQDVIERYADPLRLAGCTLSTQLEPAIFVSADRDRIEQVLVNLISNAMKYAAHCPVMISLRAFQKQASLSVKDQGIGMNDDQQTHIFERFGRASPSRNISGLGLGLYIAKEITEAHGGSIRVKSAPGEGSEFTVTLPLC
jgi:PAS domain S-box-containing protein